ncbi:sulfide/dihydroorotate dehydrogenase-like FAD/NAD-binding protein [Leptolinea tardivitalis]|uniref:Ferredoxin-NADP reductase n=1 Tax=Leptolinea tardivitalis TaxID=229920 RepID=A0A0P6XM42_9CHLR|nr:sulfide/dihydroorotate dehydrogenase-like FAD/NAD-binding protein [Leptolinea tardivitalis]KPL72952.1 ferredoxin-NADP reductase [Leptolinea tardivitalis]GAP20650.1 sulfide dehydrogenase (flavoprotein) subunit SudB [Leptolinea tardivitalis]
MIPVLERTMVAPNIHNLRLQAPDVARSAKPGQFVILQAEEDGERIPLTISDWDAEKGDITVVFMQVGATTGKLALLKAGDSIPTAAGPLGNPMELGNFGTVICVGGCYGIASIYPIARALKEMNNRVICVVEARSSFLFYWQEKLRKTSDEMIFITRDGSLGRRGHINNLGSIIPSIKGGVDRVIINGCNYVMMRGCEETRPLGIKTIVSLNTLMIDGTGMCGVCRVTVNGSNKFACVDGPHFDGHEVNWDELSSRRQAYLREETVTLRTSAPEKER